MAKVFAFLALWVLGDAVGRLVVHAGFGLFGASTAPREMIMGLSIVGLISAALLYLLHSFKGEGE